MDDKIFSTYDIRGVVPDQWDEEDAFKLGRAFGSYFLKNGVDTIYIGRDNRLSGLQIYSAIIEGLKKTGCHVVKLGLITSPMTYFAWYHFQAPATMMITGSHNPSQYNGIKSAINKNIICEKELQKIKRIFAESQFIVGQGSEEKKNIVDPYIEAITKNIHLEKPLRVIVDTANGTAGLFIRQILKKVGCQVDVLFEKSDGAFPNHQPYPQKHQFYQKLKNCLQKDDYDLGLAFDGDGDRLGAYNATGEFIENDIIAAILAKNICENNPQSTVILNISTTLGVLETIKKAGGQAILWQTGFPRITKKMKQEKAIFGGEISGHFFFADRYYGYDDAFYAALRLLEIISHGQKLEILASQVPQHYRIPEFRLPIPSGGDKYKLAKEMAENIKKANPEAKILDIDGVRFSFKDSWGLIRPSNTEPLLSGRAEGKTQSSLDKIREIINEQLKKYHFEKTI